MPTVQSLKKQLKGVKTTQKLTKAMKTIATIKFSRLNAIYSHYSEFGRQCERMFEHYGASFLEAVREKDSLAPPAVVVLGANKGMCGSFNSELLNFAYSVLGGMKSYLLVGCGKKTVTFFEAKNIPIEKQWILNDVPTYKESSALLDELIQWRRSGKISDVFVIFAEYNNMMKQTPKVFELFESAEHKDTHYVWYVPDKETFVEKTARPVFYSMFYEMVLESAIGAQAATVITMRSAYDTATEYAEKLEGQINRIRQSSVTADVIETSAERRD